MSRTLNSSLAKGVLQSGARQPKQWHLVSALSRSVLRRMFASTIEYPAESKSASPAVIPVVDIAPFLSDKRSSAAAGIINQIRKACQSTGFFQIVNHGVPVQLQSSVLDASKKFFDLPADQKLELDAKINPGHRGYDVLESQSYEADVLPDRKEGFYVGNDIAMSDPRTKSGRFYMGPNVWPKSLAQDQFKVPIEAYYSAVYDLSLHILDMIAEALPYDVHALFRRFTHPDLVAAPLRLLHYPPARQTSQRQLGASAHTDFGAITILLGDGNAGLQVLDQTQGIWLEIPPIRNAYVVNVGDMLEQWSDGLFKSSVHRVVNGPTVDRYSVAFFFDGNLDCPLLPLGRQNAQPLTDILTVEKHMLRRMSQSYGKK